MNFTTIEQRLAVRRQNFSRIKSTFQDGFVGFRELFSEEKKSNEAISKTKESPANSNCRTPLQVRNSNILSHSEIKNQSSSKKTKLNVNNVNVQDQMVDITPKATRKIHVSSKNYINEQELSSEFQQVTIHPKVEDARKNYINQSKIESKVKEKYPTQNSNNENENSKVASKESILSLNKSNNSFITDTQESITSNAQTNELSPIRSRDKLKLISPIPPSKKLSHGKILFTDTPSQEINFSSPKKSTLQVSGQNKENGWTKNLEMDQINFSKNKSNTNEDRMQIDETPTKITQIKEEKTPIKDRMNISLSQIDTMDIDTMDDDDNLLSTQFTNKDEDLSMKNVSFNQTEKSDSTFGTLNLKSESFYKSIKEEPLDKFLSPDRNTNETSHNTSLQLESRSELNSSKLNTSTQSSSQTLAETSIHSISPSSRTSSIASQNDSRNVSTYSDDIPSNQISSFKARLHRLKSTSKRLVNGNDTSRDSSKDESLHQEAKKTIKHVALRDLPPSPTVKFYSGDSNEKSNSFSKSLSNNDLQKIEENENQLNVAIKSESMSQSINSDTSIKRKENPLSVYRIDREIPPFDPVKRQKIGKVQRISNNKSRSSSPSKSDQEEIKSSASSTNIVSSFKNLNTKNQQNATQDSQKKQDYQSSIPLYSTATAFSNLATGILTFFKGEEPKKVEKQKKIVIPSLLQAEAVKQKQIEKEKMIAQRKQNMKMRREKRDPPALNNSQGHPNSKNPLNSIAPPSQNAAPSIQQSKKRKLEKKNEPSRKRSRTDNESSVQQQSTAATSNKMMDEEQMNVSKDSSFVSVKSNVSTASTYQISEGWKSESDAEDEAERNQKYIPHWARGKEFREQLSFQHSNKEMFNGDKIFGPCAKYCNLQEIFPTSSHFRSRSSGMWSSIDKY